MATQSLSCSRCKGSIHESCLSKINSFACSASEVKQRKKAFKQGMLKPIAPPSPQKEEEKESLGFFSDFFGFYKPKIKAQSPEKRIGFLAKVKNSFAFRQKTPVTHEIKISTPTNFTHVTGTSKLKLISLDQAKEREREFQNRN